MAITTSALVGAGVAGFSTAKAFDYPLLVALRSRSSATASAARCPERIAPSIELVSRWSPQA